MVGAWHRPATYARRMVSTKTGTGAARDVRKRLGSWYTPPELVSIVVDGVMRDIPDEVLARDTPVRVLDPACGDGRFLAEVGRRLTDRGQEVELTGCDIDAAAIESITDSTVRTIRADALQYDWADERFHIVIGNPPFLSQMAATTTRGGSSRHGGGPYADAAAEFLSLSVRLADPHRGRVALVLPQSILAARDTGPVRQAVADRAELAWSWWEPSQRHFDAAVNVCVLGFRLSRRPDTDATAWTRVITDPLGVPWIDTAALATDRVVGDRADLNVNFRDEYYALVAAVSDEAAGPPLVTSGLIDPGVCHWGRRPVRFAKRRLEHPRVDLTRLTGRFPAWAARKLVPKVIVANQTRIIEAVADPEGAWIPGVPVITVTPTSTTGSWEIAAMLTSPVASALAWQAAAGTGLSTSAIRIGPASLSALPWPRGSLDEAVAALRAGDVRSCGRAVDAAFDLDDDRLLSWWIERLPARG